MYINNYFSVANYNKANVGAEFTTIKNKDDGHDILLNIYEPYAQIVNVVINHKQAKELLNDLVSLLNPSFSITIAYPNPEEIEIQNVSLVQ